MLFQLAIRLSAPPYHPSSTDDQNTAKEQKLIKQCLLPPPHRLSTQSSQYQNWKANKCSILTLIELGPPVLESSTGSQNFMPSTDSEPKFYKTRIENWLPIRIQSRIILIGNPQSLLERIFKVLYNHPWSFGITLETFHFPRTVQVLSNTTPITQSSINPHNNKNQPSLT